MRYRYADPPHGHMLVLTLCQRRWGGWGEELRVTTRSPPQIQVGLKGGHVMNPRERFVEIGGDGGGGVQTMGSKQRGLNDL
jgi:hypothetical protein